MNIFTMLYNFSNDNIFFILLAFSVFLSFFKKFFKTKKCYNYIIAAFIILYICFTFYITIFSRLDVRYPGDYCLIPFYSYYLLKNGQTEMLRESVLNILFFYPLGYLFGSLNTEKTNAKKWIIIPVSCLLSIVIEVMQYIFRLGFAEIDDVIHNTLGCAVGLCVCILIEKLLKINKHGGFYGQKQ